MSKVKRELAYTKRVMESDNLVPKVPLKLRFTLEWYQTKQDELLKLIGTCNSRGLTYTTERDELHQHLILHITTHTG